MYCWGEHVVLPFKQRRTITDIKNFVPIAVPRSCPPASPKRFLLKSRCFSLSVSYKSNNILLELRRQIFFSISFHWYSYCILIPRYPYLDPRYPSWHQIPLPWYSGMLTTLHIYNESDTVIECSHVIPWYPQQEYQLICHQSHLLKKKLELKSPTVIIITLHSYTWTMREF